MIAVVLLVIIGLFTLFTGGEEENARGGALL